MKIPDTIKVGGHTLKVEVMRMDKCGELDREKGVLYLADWLLPSQRDSTFLHEILHAINNELDHVLLDSLAEQLYQVLADNKLLR